MTGVTDVDPVGIREGAGAQAEFRGGDLRSLHRRLRGPAEAVPIPFA
jgi:hypothetical protein